MKLTITVNCNGDAIVTDPYPELRRVLVILAERVGPRIEAEEPDEGKVLDTNGNSIVHWTLAED